MTLFFSVAHGNKLDIIICITFPPTWVFSHYRFFMVRTMLAAFNGVAEVMRSPFELGALYTWWPWLSRLAPRGRGQPVLVLPGFSCSDTMTQPLREKLSAHGYTVYGWKGGINTGFNPATAAHLVARLHEIFEENGGKKVRLIGHSLGGIFARELARDFPHLVDRVVTLGSPFGMREEEAPAILLRMYKMFNPHGDHDELSDHDLHLRRLTPPPGVPVTSIYSTSDGVVPWRACLNPDARHSENIAVVSSHLGIIYHPLSVAALLDRLAAPKKSWKPFDAGKYTLFYSFAAASARHKPENPDWRHHDQARQLFPARKPRK